MTPERIEQIKKSINSRKTVAILCQSPIPKEIKMLEECVAEIEKLQTSLSIESKDLDTLKRLSIDEESE